MPSSQKLQIWLKPNCTWMFIRWPSTNLRFFVPVWNSKWRLFPTGIKNSNLVKDIPMIIHVQFGFSQFISFREEDLWNFSQSEHIIGHLDQRSRWTIAITWHPSSVVCKLFTFQASSPKPLGRLEPNLAGMF
jgi:hypothetical protein